MDINKIRKDFPMLNNNKTMQGHPFSYFDNAATTLKPKCVIDKICEYYEFYSVNSHRGDYDLAQRVDDEILKARDNVCKLINADEKEVIFTSGATMGLNQIAQGLKRFLSKDDEILITDAEHASNVLPWFRIASEIGCKVNYIPLENGRITIRNIKKVISSKTKIVSIAHVTNVLGYVNDIKEIAKFVHGYNEYFVCDGAQSVPHFKVDVKDLDVDFLVFSGHKMCGPTGIGVMYGKYELLKEIDSLLLGGGMNTEFDLCGNFGYLKTPFKFEAGTQNIAGIIGLGKAIEYLNEIGMDNIEKYERELKEYAVTKLLNEVPELIIYNKDSEAGIIDFNYEGVHAQDMGTLLGSYGICVRTGEHCAKLLHNEIGTNSTVRASLYFYNTKEEIDRFVEACKKGRDFLDVFFA